MSYDANDGWAVDGPITGTVQAKNEGDVPILESDGKLPGGMIPDVAIQFTVPATAWAGEGPYTASVSAPGVEGIATPIIGPDAPDAEAREVLADAMISVVSVSSAGVVQLVADGDKPTAPLNLVATGTKGTQTGCFIGAFGTGGGGTNFYLNVHVSASAGSPDLSGITVSAVPTTGTAVTGSTNGEGECTLSVKQGQTYTVTLAKTNFTFSPASSSVTIQDTSTDLDVSCYEAPKLTVVCSGTDKAGRQVTCTPDEGEGEVITATTGQDGRAEIVLEIANYTITVDYPTGQGVSPESTTLSAAAGGVYTKNFTILDEPTVQISVVDHSSLGNQNGRTITATPTSGGSAVTAQTTNGSATLTLMAGTSYIISCDTPTGYVAAANYPLTPLAGQTYTHTFDLYEEAKVTVSVAPSAVASGRTITATAAGMPTVTKQTDSTGQVTLSLPEGSWTIACDAPAGYYTPATQQLQTVAGEEYTKSFSLDARPVLQVTATPTAAASGLLVRAVGDTTVTAYTNTQGVATLTLDEDDYMVTVNPPAGYLAPAGQSLTAAKNQTYQQSYALQTKPIVQVTVQDTSGEGFQSGRTVTATSQDSDDVVTGTTNSSGTATLTLNGTGQYVITTDLPEGATSESVTITAAGGGSYTATLVLSFGWTHGVTFNAATFKTDDAGCLAYADDLVGQTPVNNTATSLAKFTQEGYWAFDPSTGMDAEGCFYATFTSAGVLHQLLNPYDLSKYIAVWNDSSKEWDYGQTGNSAITTENTMFCVPTYYRKGETGKITHSSKAGSGTAYAHTIDGHVYQYKAIGVYLGYNNGGKLMSISGVTATRSQTRATFRTQAAANTVRNGHAMVWNYHDWRMMFEKFIIRAKRFNGQKLAQGGQSYNSPTTGLTNALGPYAGNSSGQSNAMKFLIENYWGCCYQFLDDVYCQNTTMYVGQNSSPTDNSSNKTAISLPYNTTGFPGEIETSDIAWGMGHATGGSSTTGLCDYQDLAFGTQYPLVYVGGGSGNVSGGYAGPSYVGCRALSGSDSNYGARLAFAFDL